MLFVNHINKQVEKALYDPPAQEIDYAENKSLMLLQYKDNYSVN